MHHFGADEVAYIWNTSDDNKLFENFLNWLPHLVPGKSRIIWDDPLTDEEKNVNLSKDWIVQTWHDGSTEDVLDKGHRVVVSEADAFYIGNASAKKIAGFSFPCSPNVLGFELVWFTSEGDNPEDWKESWVMEPIKAASRIRRRNSLKLVF